MTETTVPPTPPPSAVEQILPAAVQVVTDPHGFFQTMPREGGYEAPGIFAAAMLFVYAAVFALFALFHMHIVAMLSALILMPIFGAIGLLIGSAILLFLSRALGGEATFESSFRISAYTSALSPIAAVASIVPYLPILVQAYGLYIVIIAVIAVHKVPEQTAWKVLGTAGAILLLFALWTTHGARRMAPRLEELNRRLERNARELDKAGKTLQQEMEKAMQHRSDGAKEEAPE